MAVKCVFCKEPIDWPVRHKLKDVRMYMFKRIMKKHFFNKQQMLDCPLCDDCDKTLHNFYNCKADIASTNDDFLNYMDSNKKVDLYKALVSMEKLKRFEDESVGVKVCRICFKATQEANYREVKSWDGNFAKMIMLCLPEFDIGLTNHTYFCPECYSTLLQYNHFLLLCLEVTKPKKRYLDNTDPLELTPNDLKEKRQKMNSNLVGEKVTAEPLSMTSLLLPAVPKKRGRGRPRKGEEINKPYNKQKVTKKKIAKGKLIKTKLPKDKLTEKNSKVTKEMEETEEKNSKETVLKYECRVCSKVLSNIPSLNEHMGKHNKETKFLCWHCGYFCSNFEHLKLHFIEHQIGLYRIVRDSQQVSQIEKNVQVLKNNLLEKQKEEKKIFPPTEDPAMDETPYYECQICPGVFDNIEILRDHLNGHKSSTSFRCWRCGIKTYNFESFRQHLMAHGLINIYKTKFPGDNSPLNKESSLNKDSFKNGTERILPTKSIIGVTCSTCKETMNNLEEYLDHTCPLPSKSTSDIPCSSCTERLDNLDDYINHSCTNKQHFSCGHCSKMFYSLDDLDEHNCNVATTSVGVENKSKSKEVSSSILSDTLLQGTPAKRTTMSAPIRNSDPEYECSYCLKSFSTVTALDMHSCTGEPENATAVIKSRNVSEIKTEKELACDVCMSVCETEHELSLHKCIRPANGKFEGRITIRIDNSFKCGFCLSLFDTENEMNKHMCSKKSVLTGNNTNEDKVNEIKTEEIDLATIQKKALINKIAGMFGVKIVEESEKKMQNMATLRCDGCSLKCNDENDLKFHYKYYCPSVRTCDFCSYKTYTIQKLEIHTLKAHNIVIFACLHCRFTTYMEENFKLHIPTHNDAAKKNKTSEKINLELNPTPNIILNYTDAVKKNVGSLVPLAPNSFDDLTRTKSTNSERTNFVIKMPKENNELIIPDIVEKDPLLLETQDEAFNENSNSSTLTSDTLLNYSLEDSLQDIEPKTDNTSNDYLKSSTLPEGGDSTEDSHIEEQENKDQHLDKQLCEADVTIVIDDDSDSEFVESSESRMSEATTLVEEIYSVTSSEASKLISEGVPVLREASLLTKTVQPSSDKLRIISNVLSLTRDNNNTLNSTGFNNCIVTPNIADSNLLESTSKMSNEAACSSSNKADKPDVKYGKKQNFSDITAAPSGIFDGKNEKSFSMDVAVEDKAEESDSSSFFVTDSEDSNPASLKTNVVAEDSFLISDDDENESLKPPESKNVKNSNSDIFKQLVSALEKEAMTFTSKNVEKKSEEPKNNVLSFTDVVVRSRSDPTLSVELSGDSSKEVEDKGEQPEEDSGDDCIFVSEENGQSKNIMSSSDSTQKAIGTGKNKSSSNDNNPNKVQRPPNALQIFISKAKSEMQRQYPHLKWGKQKKIITNAWKGLSDKQKWPFKEEARLHKLLFKRENPEFYKRKTKAKPVNQPPEVTFEDIQEIILD